MHINMPAVVVLTRIVRALPSKLTTSLLFSGLAIVFTVLMPACTSPTLMAEEGKIRMRPEEQAHITAWQSLKNDTAAPKVTLRVTIRGLNPRSGFVRIGLYDAKIAFPVEGHHLEARAIAVQGEASVTAEFTVVPYGVYALAVIHDRNGNGKLDYRWGIFPAEPVAFSSGAKPRMFGPPTFDAAKFAVTGDVALLVDLN